MPSQFFFCPDAGHEAADGDVIYRDSKGMPRRAKCTKWGDCVRCASDVHGCDKREDEESKELYEDK